MYLLVTAATRFEIRATMEWLERNPGLIKSANISILITGAGMVAATYALTNAIHEKRPDIIIQAGIGGCFTDHPLSETFVITEDSIADMGVTENHEFKNIFDLKLADKNEFPFTNGKLLNHHANLIDLLQVPHAAAITVNEITTSTEKINWYKQHNHAVIESMEGAALHYVGLMQKVPFIQLRALSNYIGERDKSKWQLRESMVSLNKNLILLIEEISKHDEIYFRV